MKYCSTCKRTIPENHFPANDDYCYMCHRTPKQQKAKAEKSYSQIRKESINSGKMSEEDFYQPRYDDFVIKNS